MADLTKAMQTAAESARADVLEKFSAEAKSHIEAIHASTANEATELRKRADEDIAGIREWSKNEIARIREETDERITHRRTSSSARSRRTRPDRSAHRACPVARDLVRRRDGRVLRAAPVRGGSDPLRGDGRDAARAALVRQRRRAVQ